MSLTHALLIDGVILWISGFLVGIGLKTIIDGFARRDDYDRRFEGIEGRLEVLEDDLDEINIELGQTQGRVDDLESEDDEPSDDDVDAAVEMPRPPANLPNLDYDYSQQFVSPPMTYGERLEAIAEGKLVPPVAKLPEQYRKPNE